MFRHSFHIHAPPLYSRISFHDWTLLSSPGSHIMTSLPYLHTPFISTLLFYTRSSLSLIGLLFQNGALLRYPDVSSMVGLIFCNQTFHFQNRESLSLTGLSFHVRASVSLPVFPVSLDCSFIFHRSFHVHALLL